MRAAPTFVNKPTGHARAISRHYETGGLIPNRHTIPLGIKRVHINSPNFEGIFFQTF